MLNNQDFARMRASCLGGSDIGAVLGLNRYRSAVDVWMEKTGRVSGVCDSLALRFGSFAESFIASEYELATGLSLVAHDAAVVHPQYGYLCGHIDRFVCSGPLFDAAGSLLASRVLECKTDNVYTQSEWGEVGTDQVPLSYLVQCLWYLMLTGLEQADLAVLFGNSDFRIYEITRDKELENMVIQKATTFWQEHVLKDIPPPAMSEQDCHTLFGKGDSSKTVEAKTETIELTKRLQLLNDEIEVREEEISSIKQSIMNQMQEAETLTYQGKVLATWRAPKPSFRLDSKRLELDHPEITSNYKIQVQNSRRLVVKQAN